MSSAPELRAVALKAFMSGKFEDASLLYQEAVAVDPSDGESLRGLAMTLGRLGRTDEAVEWARKLVAALPSDALAHTTLSMMLQRQGKIPEAEAAQAQARTLGWKDQLKGKP